MGFRVSMGSFGAGFVGVSGCLGGILGLGGRSMVGKALVNFCRNSRMGYLIQSCGMMGPIFFFFSLWGFFGSFLLKTKKDGP